MDMAKYAWLTVGRFASDALSLVGNRGNGLDNTENDAESDSDTSTVGEDVDELDLQGTVHLCLWYQT